MLNNRHFYIFDDIELLRILLINDHKTIEVNDFGAGSHTLQCRNRKISDIARTSLIKKKYGRMLFRAVNTWQPETVLEIGTSLGISTLYLAHAHTSARVITLEGSPEVAVIARKNFEKTGAQNITLLEGEFSETLPKALAQIDSPGFVFIDGNQRKEPTIEYFTTCLKQSTENTVFVFDDIYWSADMENAWNEIKQHPSVTLTIDLFFKGFVFLRKDFHQKQHFVLRF